MHGITHTIISSHKLLEIKSLRPPSDSTLIIWLRTSCTSSLINTFKYVERDRESVKQELANGAKLIIINPEEGSHCVDKEYTIKELMQDIRDVGGVEKAQIAY